MQIKRIKHAVSDLKYHLVWIPKHRKQIPDKEISDYIKEILGKIAEEYGFEIDTMKVTGNHVHIFVEALPRYSPAQIVQVMKSISAREVFRKYRKLKKELWAGELWNDGYFVRSVGDEVTADVIRRYIKYQAHENESNHLKMFEQA